MIEIEVKDYRVPVDAIENVLVNFARRYKFAWMSDYNESSNMIRMLVRVYDKEKPEKDDIPKLTCTVEVLK